MIADERRILDAFRRVVQAVRSGTAETERRLGVSGAQLFLLRALAQDGPLALGEVARRTATHASSASVVAAKLVAAGLVERRAAPEDRRRIALSATARGRALLRRAPTPEQESLVLAVRRLPAPRRRDLADALTGLLRAMGLPTGGAAPMFFEGDRATVRRRRRRG